MKIWPDCIPCIMRMSVSTARTALGSDTQLKSFMDWLLQLNHFSQTDWNVTSPEIVRDVWLMMRQMFGIMDPLEKTKKKQNEFARALYPLVKDNENYRLLPSQVAQQTMKVVDRTFKSFMRLLRELKKGNYKRPVKLFLTTITRD